MGQGGKDELVSEVCSVHQSHVRGLGSGKGHSEYF